MSAERDERPIEHLGRVIRAEFRTTATPGQVYEAWADPEKVAHWFPDKAEGKAVPGETITWIFDKFNYRIPYEVLRAEPGKQFTIRWNPPPGMNAGILDVTMERTEGVTRVRLVNSGFREGAQWNDEYEGVDSGWQMALSVLKLYLEKYFGTPRSSFMAMIPASFAFEQLPAVQRTSAGLQKWLTTSGDMGDVGGLFALELQDGGKVSGRVLAKTKLETELEWQEIRGALGLKGFAMGAQKMIGVHGCGWGLSLENAKAIEQRMERALERLARALGTQEASA